MDGGFSVFLLWHDVEEGFLDNDGGIRMYGYLGCHSLLRSCWGSLACSIMKCLMNLQSVESAPPLQYLHQKYAVVSLPANVIVLVMCLILREVD